MNILPLIATIAAVAFLGIGSIKNMLPGKSRAPLDAAGFERQLKKDGAAQANGTIKVDAQFDVELNAMLKELTAIERESDAELKAIDTTP